MKRAAIIKLAIVGLSTILVMACQKDEDKSQVQTVRGGAPTVNANSDLALAGTISSDPAYAREFDDAAHGLLAAYVPESAVCQVAPQGAIKFGGRIALVSGTPQQAATSNQKFNVNNSGRFRLQVTDRCDGQRDQTGQSIAPLPAIEMSRSEGYVAGTYALIRFTNNAGYIEFEGSFDRNEFVGTAIYSNFRSIDGGRGDSGTLGQFKIPTCQFFGC